MRALTLSVASLITEARELGDLAVYPGGPFFMEEGPVSHDGELAV